MEMRQLEIVFCIILFIFMCVLRFGSSDDFGHEHPSKEYATVFKNIPLVFEHLLQMLEEKPEVLEKDDISVFNKRQAEYRDETAESEIADESNDRELKKRAVEQIAEENKNYKDYAEYQHTSIGEEDTIDSDDASNTDEKDFYEDFYKSDPKDVSEIKKEEITQHVQNKLYMLTSDEIAEQSIIIEQMLEKQNSEER